jgi:hypothetical protein
MALRFPPRAYNPPVREDILGCNDLSPVAAMGRDLRGGQVAPGGKLWVCMDNQVVTATAAVAGGGWNNYVLTPEAFEPTGWLTQDLTLHIEASNLDTGFSYRVILQRRLATGAWRGDDNDAVIVIAQASPPGPITDANYRTATPYSNRNYLGARLRLVLQCQLASGSVPANATINALLFQRYWSC